MDGRAGSRTLGGDAADVELLGEVIAAALDRRADGDDATSPSPVTLGQIVSDVLGPDVEGLDLATAEFALQVFRMWSAGSPQVISGSPTCVDRLEMGRFLARAVTASRRQVGIER